MDSAMANKLLGCREVGPRGRFPLFWVAEVANALRIFAVFTLHSWPFGMEAQASDGVLLRG